MAKFSIKNLTKEQKQLRKRILDISFMRSFSHLGSCFTAIDMIYMVYKMKRPKDSFVLSNGHAAVALYAVLEKFKKIKDMKITNDLHVHPDRNKDLDIYVSSGSLGQGFPISLGMALANPKRTVYCMISDGESTEGSIWEGLHAAHVNNIANVILLVNANGWGAYSKISQKYLVQKLIGFGVSVLEVDGHNIKEIQRAVNKKVKGMKVIFGYTNSNQFSFLRDQDAHYRVMTEEEYKNAIQLLS